MQLRERRSLNHGNVIHVLIVRLLIHPLTVQQMMHNIVVQSDRSPISHAPLRFHRKEQKDHVPIFIPNINVRLNEVFSFVIRCGG